MTNTISAIDSTVASLEKKGFRWTQQDNQTVYLSRKRGCQTVMAQVDCYDGATVTVNGKTLASYLAWLKTM